MQIREYETDHWRTIAELFNACFAGRYRAMPSAMSKGAIRDMLADKIHEATSSAAWVAVEDDSICGFVSAHARGKEQGIVTTPVFPLDDTKTGEALLQIAEVFLRKNGAQSARVEGVGREYNVGFGETLHLWLLERGYTSYHYREKQGVDLIMELDFDEFSVPDSIVEMRRRSEGEGFVFELMRERDVQGFRKLAWGDWMLYGLEAPLNTEPTRYPYIICRKNETVVGFCGGLSFDVQHGTGGFSFITREEDYRGRGIGAVMLSMALAWLKGKGVKVQVLSTGLDNPAQKLYLKVGFRYSFVSTTTISRQLGRIEDC